MRGKMLIFFMLISTCFLTFCAREEIDADVPSIYISWKTDMDSCLFSENSPYEPFSIVFKDMTGDWGETGVFDTFKIRSNTFILPNITPINSEIDFGNGDLDTLEIRGDAGNSAKTVYYLSSEIDFFYNGELQVSWDLEEGVATYHYDGGRQESIPKRDNIGDDTRFNYLLLKKDSASMADIGFE